MRRADRLMKIVHFMRSRRYAVTAQHIAEEFEVSTRTIYRDIQDLMDVGAPIQGEAGVGYVIDKDYYLPPIAFDQDELEALTLGINVVRQWTDDTFAATALKALEKIQAALPTELQDEFQHFTTISGRAAPLPWDIHFSDLRDCIRTRRKVRLAYQDPNGQDTDRTIQPLALIFFSPAWLLAGWCELRQDFRNFRLDRIQELHITDRTFPDDPARNLAAYRGKEDCV